MNGITKIVLTITSALALIAGKLDGAAKPETPEWFDSPLFWRDSPRFNERADAARAAYKAGDSGRAIKLYNEALAMRPNKEAKQLTLIRRGNAYLDNNEPDRAIADFNQALWLGACRACIFLNRGLAYKQKGEIEKALGEFERAIQSDPGYGAIYYNRGGIYWDQEDYKKALAEYSKAVEFQSNDVDTRVARAQTYIRRHQNQMALADLDVALQFDPKSTSAFTTRAVIYVQEASYPQANKEIDAAVNSLSGKNIDSRSKPYALESLAWFWATSTADALRDGKKAVAYANKACELNHWKNWGLISVLAAACAEAGDFDSAIKYQKRVLGMMPPYKKYVDDEKERLELYRKHQPYRDVIKP